MTVGIALENNGPLQSKLNEDLTALLTKGFVRFHKCVSRANVNIRVNERDILL